MRLFSVCFSLSLLACSQPAPAATVAADCTAGAEAPSADATQPSTEASTVPDTSVEEDVRALLESTNALAHTAQLVGPLLQTLAQAHPNVPDKVWRELYGGIGTDAFIEMLVEVYSAHYTREQIRGLLQFYESDLGRAMVEKMPAVIAASQQAGMKWGQQVAQELMQGARNKGYEL